MTKQQIRQLFRTLATTIYPKINLLDEGWEIIYDNAKTRLGSCKWPNRQISLSTHYLHLPEIENTLRHEMAHAFDYELRGKSDHSRTWKMWAVRCGAIPERLSNVKHEPRYKYTATCPSCGYKTGFYRKPKRKYSCHRCDKNYNERHRFKLKQNY